MTRRIATVFVMLGSLTLGAQQAPPAAPAPPPTTRELGIKYVRDSEEYATLARQTYRSAGDAVTRATAAGVSTVWAVVLDVDETVLDNSTYQLERAAYGGPLFENTSWSAWVTRREAPAVPGAAAFVAMVRGSGGRVAYITNRDAALTDPTRANLQALGLWSDQDRLCPQKNPAHTKAQRRHEVVSGAGDCSWSGTPMRIVAFVGDQIGDFPDESEAIPQAGSDTAFGRTCFLLPNPMYGGWTARVTRRP